MIRLTTTTQKLQALMSGAIATANSPIVAGWSDKTASTYNGGASVINTNGVTAVDIVAAPAASTTRDVDYISCRNSDSAAITLTFRYNDNATLYTIRTFTLAVGDHVDYTHANGWHVTDSNGNDKTTTSIVLGATLTGGTATRVIFTGSGPVLTDDAEFTYNSSTNVLTVNGSTFGTNSQVGGTLGVTGATTLSAALTYGGVALSNAVTGTGSMVLSASPTLTGTLTAAAGSFTTLGASGAVNANLTTDSTSISTGSLLTAGGLGVTKALWVGGLMNIAGAVTLQSTLTVTGEATFNGGMKATLPALGANTGNLVLLKSDGTLTTDAGTLTWDSASDVLSVNGLTLSSSRVSGPADNTYGSNGQTGLTVSNTGNVNATLNGGLTCGSGSYTAGAALTFGRILKSVTGIANAVATDTITVTIPNAAHSASLKLTLKGSLGAGGAIGANEATGTISYDVAIARTAGVATVAVASTAYGSATASVAGAATITITAAVSAISGANSATQTFTITTTISRGSSTSDNHTCQVLAEVINANATGVSIA